ncbi:potassium channel family protein [Phaeobacter sp. PT47_59]|uniref:potassium channel family protein n=1 Tax=Phaeobacter sp. PT47_59 TaxID=3029979 RepID=UPI00237FFA67|nr:potassium channel family protein [Phaeobacter sp. PT47_59]MDE4174997.1 potassium channel family protein [Phaeobacter sp. PT47_59]
MQFKRSSIFATLIGIIALSTVFFHYAEGWNWLDSLFFTVVTISTVGYGNFVPVTAAGKIGTIVLICSGLGVFALAVREFALYQIQKREEHSEWLVAHLGRHNSADPPGPANEDDCPDPAPFEPGQN